MQGAEKTNANIQSQHLLSWLILKIENVCQKVDELDKNHSADNSPYDMSCDGHMYEKLENALCPVKCFELYLSKLNLEIECLK